MARRERVPTVPNFSDPEQQRWAELITEAINFLPSFSIFSTSDGPNSSTITTERGVIGIEVGSSTTLLWVGSAEGTSTWSALSYIL